MSEVTTAEAMVTAELASWTKSYETAKADFISKFEVNPAHTIEWQADTIVTAQTRYEIALHIQFTLDNDVAVNLLDALKIQITELTELMTRRYYAKRSTNPYDNANDTYVKETQAKVIGSLQSMVSSIVKAMESSTAW